MSIELTHRAGELHLSTRMSLMRRLDFSILSLLVGLGVLLEVTPARLPAQSLVLSAASAAFTGIHGGATPAAQTVNVTSSGGTLNRLRATVTYASGQPTGWLAALPSSTSAPSTLRLTPNMTGLSIGRHNATVTISANKGTAQTITVTLAVVRDPKTFAGLYALSPIPTTTCSVLSTYGFGTTKLHSLGIAASSDSLILTTNLTTGVVSWSPSASMTFDTASQSFFDPVAQTFQLGPMPLLGTHLLNNGAGTVSWTGAFFTTGAFTSLSQLKGRVEIQLSFTVVALGVKQSGTCTPVAVDVVGTK